MTFMGGVALWPRVYKNSGISPRDNWSAVVFSFVEIYLVEIFKSLLYLMRSIAATTAHTYGFGARRLVSQATTFILSVKSVSSRCWVNRGANVYNAAQAAKSSSQAISMFGNDSQPSHVSNHGFNCSMDQEKYRSPQYPPIPPVSEASTYIGG